MPTDQQTETVEIQLTPGVLLLVRAAYELGQADLEKGVTAHDPAAITRDALKQLSTRER